MLAGQRLVIGKAERSGIILALCLGLVALLMYGGRRRWQGPHKMDDHPRSGKLGLSDDALAVRPTVFAPTC